MSFTLQEERRIFMASLMLVSIDPDKYGFLKTNKILSAKDIESIVLGRVAAYFQLQGRHDLVKSIATNFVDISSDAKWRKYLKTS